MLPPCSRGNRGTEGAVAEGVAGRAAPQSLLQELALSRPSATSVSQSSSWCPRTSPALPRHHVLTLSSQDPRRWPGG